MSFIDKIKTMFNLGGMNVEFQVPSEIDKQSGELEGTVILQAAGERKIKKVLVKLDQHISKDDGSMEILTIGSTEYPIDATLKAGENKPLAFKLKFNPKDSIGEKIADKISEKLGGIGGVLGAVVNMNSQNQHRQRTYTVKVIMDVEGALWKPEEATGIKLI